MAMKARIINYRRGRRIETSNQCILEVKDVTSREGANALLGKAVKWTNPVAAGTEISGRIMRVHGNKGAVVARFTRGLPGQAIGTDAEIL